MEERAAQRKRDKLENILHLSLLLNSERDFDRMFDLIVTQVSLIMEADRTSLFLLDAERNELWTRSAEGIEGMITVPVGKGLAGKVAENGESRIVDDAWEDPDFDASWDRKHGYRTRSVLCQPVRTRNGELKGVLEIINKEQGTFGAEDEDLTAALAAQIGVALETQGLLEELVRGFESFARTLARAVEAKHPLTAGHSIRVTEYSLLLGRALGLSGEDLHVLKYAGLLHDIGKIGVPDRVLTKMGRFEPEERTLMNSHASWSFRILSEIRLPKSLRDVPRVAACHHEKIDGTGYPGGLRGEEIPLLSRIMAVGDVFDALTFRRDYPKYDGEKTFGLDPFPMEKAFSIIERDGGSHFDPDVVAAALKSRDELTEAFARLAAPPRPGERRTPSAARPCSRSRPPVL